MTKLSVCLLRQAKELKDFNKDEVVEASRIYQTRGRSEDEANVLAIEDHLRDLRTQRKAIVDLVLEQFKSKDPAKYGELAAATAAATTRDPATVTAEEIGDIFDAAVDELFGKEEPTASERDSAMAELGQGIDELISLFGGKTNMLPEEEARLIPIMSKIFRAAAKLGYLTFKEAGRFVLGEIRGKSREVADKLSIENLQAGYINIAKEIGGDKRAALDFDSIEQLMAADPAPNPEIEAAAHEAAASPKNDKPQPTDAQKEAGNYAKGHVTIQGLDISIENPQGSVRSGTSPDGKKWENKLAHHYGYIKGTVGADKDHIDIFVTPGADIAPMAWVIDQKNRDGSFDEHKVVLGPLTESDARAAYLANYDAGWQGLGSITSLPMAAFRAWAKSPLTKKPLSYVQSKADTPIVKESAPSDAAAATIITDEKFAESKGNLEADKQRLLERFPIGTRVRVSRDSLSKDDVIPLRDGVVTKGHFGGWYVKLDPTPRERTEKEVLILDSKSNTIERIEDAIQGVANNPGVKLLTDNLLATESKEYPEDDGTTTTMYSWSGEIPRGMFDAFASVAEKTDGRAGAKYSVLVEDTPAASTLIVVTANFTPTSKMVDVRAQMEVATKVAGGKSDKVLHENATAPEHIKDETGVTVAELKQIAKAFRDAIDSGADAGVTHVFDSPEKGEIVRLKTKADAEVAKSGWLTPEQAKARVQEWRDRAAEQYDNDDTRSANSQKIVISLFDLTGKWSQPWEDAGYQVFRFDIQNGDEAEHNGEIINIGDINNFSTDFFNDIFASFDGLDIHAILAACPCTDFAVSGARHFAAKDEDGRTVASIKLVKATLATIEYFKPAVWALENPVGRIEELTGLPPWRLSFDPNHLGDTYTKKTLIWGRFNADLPVAPVEPTEGSKMHSQYGGKSQATKNARSATPEGFAYSFFMANNAADHPVLAIAGKYDRLDRGLIEKAVAAGVTEEQISEAVDDLYYMDLDDDAANEAISDLLPKEPKPPKEAPFMYRYNGMTWTGKGKQPAWVQAYLQEPGNTLDTLREESLKPAEEPVSAAQEVAEQPAEQPVASQAANKEQSWLHDEIIELIHFKGRTKNRKALDKIVDLLKRRDAGEDVRGGKIKVHIPGFKSETALTEVLNRIQTRIEAEDKAATAERRSEAAKAKKEQPTTTETAANGNETPEAQQGQSPATQEANAGPVVEGGLTPENIGDLSTQHISGEAIAYIEKNWTGADIQRAAELLDEYIANSRIDPEVQQEELDRLETRRKWIRIAGQKIADAEAPEVKEKRTRRVRPKPGQMATPQEEIDRLAMLANIAKAKRMQQSKTQADRRWGAQLERQYKDDLKFMPVGRFTDDPTIVEDLWRGLASARKENPAAGIDDIPIVEHYLVSADQGVTRVFGDEDMTLDQSYASHVERWKTPPISREYFEARFRELLAGSIDEAKAAYRAVFGSLDKYSEERFNKRFPEFQEAYGINEVANPQAVKSSDEDLAKLILGAAESGSRMYGTSTSNRLYGPDAEAARQTILAALTGAKVPKSKSGHKATMEALYDRFGVMPDAIATMERELDKALLKAAGLDKSQQDQESGEPTVDSKGNPIHKVGDRVEITEGGYKGRHGEVTNVNATRWQVLGFGARVDGPGAGVDYSYNVKTDAGAEVYASASYLKPETERPENVVMDPIFLGAPIEPQYLFDRIGREKKSAESFRASAQRARKPEAIAEHKRSALRADETAAKAQAAWDEWAQQYPKDAEAINPPKPAPQATAETAAAPVDAAGAIKAAGLKVTKTTTKNNKPVWEVSGNTKEHSGMLKAMGGRWYGPKKVWSYYNDDPSIAIAGKLGGSAAPAVVLGANEVRLPDSHYVYRKELSGGWTWRSGIGPASPLKADAPIVTQLEAILAAKNPTILGQPVADMGDRALEGLAEAETPAGEKARAELETRDAADNPDIGAIFDNVVDDLLGDAPIAATPGPWQTVLIKHGTVVEIDGQQYQVRNDYTEGHRGDGEPVSLRTMGQIARVVDKPYEAVGAALRAGELMAEAKSKAKKKIINPATPEGYAAALADPAILEEYQDELDAFFQERLIAVRNALRDLGWIKDDANLVKNGREARFRFRQVGAGRNIVGMTINGVEDRLTLTPAKLAELADLTAGLKKAQEDLDFVRAQHQKQGNYADDRLAERVRKFEKLVGEYKASIHDLGMTGLATGWAADDKVEADSNLSWEPTDVAGLEMHRTSGPVNEWRYKGGKVFAGTEVLSGYPQFYSQALVDSLPKLVVERVRYLTLERMEWYRKEFGIMGSDKTPTAPPPSAGFAIGDKVNADDGRAVMPGVVVGKDGDTYRIKLDGGGERFYGSAMLKKKERWESYEIVEAPQSGRYLVREPGKNGYQNFATFALSANGVPQRVEHFFEAESTREPARKAMEKWARERKAAEPKKPVTPQVAAPAGSTPLGATPEAKPQTDDLSSEIISLYRGKVGTNGNFTPGIIATAEKMAKAITERNAVVLADILNLSNKISRQVFSEYTKSKLPDTVGGTAEAINAFFAKQPAKEDGERFERAMRNAAGWQYEDGDVQTTALRFVPFDKALEIAREAVAAGVKPVPAQFHTRLDLTMDSALRLIAALEEKPRTAGQAATSAAKNVGMGLKDVAKGLNALFKPKPGTLGMAALGVPFDEETYAAAKPLFAAGIAHFKQAGADVAEMVRALVQHLIAQSDEPMDRATLASMKPYVVRFIEDVKAGKIVYDENQEVANNDSGTEGQGSGALEGMAPGEVGEAGSGGQGRPGADAGSNASGSGNQGVDGSRGKTRRGRGNRPAAADSAAAGSEGLDGGSGTGSGTAGDGGQTSESGSTPPKSVIPLADFVIGEDVALGSGGQMVKYRDNVAAIKLLKTLEIERRRATPEEQRTLARYVGWGGIPNAFRNGITGEIKKDWAAEVAELESILTPRELRAASASTPNAHYTAKEVVDFMWRAAARMGFNGGLVLEPSVGSGNFIGLMPEFLRGNTHVTGIELDSITARIAGALYPRSNIIQSGFEKLPLPDDRFDLAIGNPPFGKDGLRFTFSPELNGTSIHNQFFRASMDAVRPGGLQVMVVSRFLMDKESTGDRMELAKKAKLLGAIRLPGSAFKGNALTEVVTDILFLQRRSPTETGQITEAIYEQGKKVPAKETDAQRRDREARAQLLEDAMGWVNTGKIPDPAGGDPMVVSRYYIDNPHMVAGVLDRKGSMHRENDVGVSLPEGQTLEQVLADRMRFLPGITTDARSDEINERTKEQHRFLGESLTLYATGAEEGAIRYEADGTLSHVIERVGNDGDLALAKVTLTANTPWSPQLAMDLDGRWFRIVPKLDDKGNKVKAVKNGKQTKLNVYEREIFATEADVPKALRLGDKRLAVMRSLINIRDLLVEQFNLEVNSASPDAMESNRAKLREAYEAFVKDNGYISEKDNANIVAHMPDEGLLLSLESNFKREVTAAKAKATGMKQSPPTAQPAAILSRPVGIPPARQEHADTIGDALAIAMSETGRLDLNRIQELRDIPMDAVQAELTEGDTPLAYPDPENGFALADKNAYLSGNVRRKLEAARAADLKKNVAALEAIQPAPWSSDQVTPKMGASWIPPQVFAEFIDSLIGGQSRVTFAPLTNTFAVMASSDSAAATQQWGTPRMPAPELISNILNSRKIQIYDTDSEGDRHPNQEATDAALDKKREILEAFDDWIFKDADRRRTLTQIFNDEYNVRVNRQHDGSHMMFPGKVPDDIIKFRRGQINAIWRGVVEKYVLYDHAVGAGKTFTGIARAMERRRMGLSKKPMIVVPNHLVKEWQIQTYRLYPGAKVLAAGKKDMERKNRRRLFAKIATGDWDIVIVPHSSFRYISLSLETEERFLAAQLEIANAALAEAEAEQDPGSRFKSLGVKAAEALIKKIEARLDDIRSKDRDRLITFEQMGVDDLTVDESHEFKNLMYSTNLTDVRGMGTSSGSTKALDMYMKAKYLHENNGSIAFMTGTPISNSAVEMYSIMRYLAPDLLNEMGLEHFDAFRMNFVDATAAFEPTDSGSGIKTVTRLGRQWSNMRSLMDAYYSIADVVTNDDIKRWYSEDNPGKEFPLPKVAGGERRAIGVPPTPTQTRLLNQVIDGFNTLDNIEDVKERNAERLRLMDRARKVSLHGKALEPGVDDEFGGKLDVAVGEVFRLYKKWMADKGTQLIFLDRGVPKSKEDLPKIKEYDAAVAAKDAAAASGDHGAFQKASERLEAFDRDEIEALRDAQTNPWNGYQHIKDGLIAKGVPENEIAFIQNYNSDEDKEALFNAVRDGSIRVLIGSTPRMGAGTNVQERLVGLHHIDATWKPSDIEQREGRIIRQGNYLLEKYGDKFEVEIMAYVTERTVDAKLWALNSMKLKMINAIRHYDGAFEMEFDDEDSTSMAEIAAIASGDPLTLERFKLTAEVDVLYRQQRSFRRRMDAAADTLEQSRRLIDKGPAEIVRLKEIGAAAEALIDVANADASGRSMTMAGKVYRDASSAQWDLAQMIKAQKGDDEKAPVSIEIDGKEYTSKSGAEEVVARALGDSEVFLAEIHGQKVIRRGDYARGLRDIIGDEFREIREPIPAGSIYGMPVFVESKAGSYGGHYVNVHGTLKINDHGGKVTIDAEYRVTPDKWKEGQAVPVTVSDMRQVIRQIEANFVHHANNAWRISDIEKRMERAKGDIPVLEQTLTETFKFADEYRDKEARLREVEAELALRAAASAQAAQSALEPGWYRVTDADGKKEATDRQLTADDIKQLVEHGYKLQRAREINFDNYLFRAGTDGSALVVNDGKDIEIPGSEEFKFFAYKGSRYGRDTWFVVEKTTGQSIASGDTRKEAVENATSTMERVGAEGLRKNTEGKVLSEQALRNAVNEFKAPSAKGPAAGDALESRGNYDDEPVINVRQSISSANTSRKITPASVSWGDAADLWQTGNTNFDIGSGKFSDMTGPMDDRGVTNLQYDPFWLDPKDNTKAIKAVLAKGADTVTVNNILNVIKEATARRQVIRQAAKALDPAGTAVFVLWEGDKSGIGKETRDGYQVNARAADYMPAIAEFFDHVERDGHIISATGPKKALTVGKWSPVPGQPMFSSASQGNTGATATEIRDAFSDAFGAAVVRNLESNGRIQIMESADAFMATVPGITVSKTAKAVFVGDRAYFFANRMRPASAHIELLHEIGEHYGLERMIGAEGYQNLMQRVQDLRDAGDIHAAKAWEFVARNYPEEAEGSKRFMHEVLAQLGQNADIRARSWWRQLIEAAKRFLVRLGFTGRIEVADIQDMVLHSLMVAARPDPRGPGGGIRGSQMANTLASVAPGFGRVDIHSPEFKAWFGDWENGIQRERVPSQAGQGGDNRGIQEVDRLDSTDGRGLGRVGADGKPKVYFHGTKDDIEAFDLEHPNRKDKGWLGRGVYVTNEPGLADSYATLKRYGTAGENLIPLYVAVKNPYVADLSFKKSMAKMSQAAIDRVTEKLKALGHDGVVLQFKDGTEELVAFSPSSVKSAISNTGEFDSTNPDIRYSRQGPWFYSALSTTIPAMAKIADKGGMVSPAAAKAWLLARQKEGKFKADELNWSGVMDWLDMKDGEPVHERGFGVVEEYQNPDGTWTQVDDLGHYYRTRAEAEQRAKEIIPYPAELGIENRLAVREWPAVDLGKRGGKITVADIERFVRENGIKLEETVLGNKYQPLTAVLASDMDDGALSLLPGNEYIEPTDWMIFSGGKWVGTYQGGAETEAEAVEEYKAEAQREAYEVPTGDTDARHSGRNLELPGGNNPKEFVLTVPSIEPYNTGDTTHYGDIAGGRAVAWIRTNERTAADGGKVLFIEEIQSKRAQEGKKRGFGLSAAEREEMMRLNGMSIMNEGGRSRTQAENKRLDELVKRDGSPSPAPFVQDTKAWTALALKRMIAYAAENGFDSIAWTTGEQQAARYDLSKHVDSISAAQLYDGDYVIRAHGKRGAEIPGLRNKRVKADELDDIVGKDLADKIRSGEGGEFNPRTSERTYSGLDLKVGGDGMRGYYDQIVPQVANDVLKKIGGGKVESVAVQMPYPLGEAYIGGKKERIETAPMPQQQPGFAITDKMREAARSGLPLFSRAGYSPEAFAANVIQELSGENDLFRHAISHGGTIKSVMRDVYPGAKYLGDHARADETEETGADHRHVFQNHLGKRFDVYESDAGRVWLDVSKLANGDGGNQVYAAVANYAYNASKVFQGDPAGVSVDATIRRTSNMLSSAVRFGTTRHLAPSPEQTKGNSDKGIPSLKWGNDEIENLRELIHTFVRTLYTQFPTLANYRYDFAKRGFFDKNGKPVTRERFSAGARTDFGRAARAGEGSLRRGVFLKSLMEEASGGNESRILQVVLTGAGPLVEEGGLGAMFSEGNYLDELGKGVAKTLSEAVYAPRDKATAAKRSPDKWFRPVLNGVMSALRGSNTFGALDRSIHTQLHKAQKNRHFGEVFKRVQHFMEDASRAALRPAELAPTVLPRIDVAQNAIGAIKSLIKGKEAAADIDAAFAVALRGTLADTIYPDAESAGLTDDQFRLYREIRDSVDASLDELSASEAWGIARPLFLNLLGNLTPAGLSMKKSILANPDRARETLLGRLAVVLEDATLRANELTDIARDAAPFVGTTDNPYLDLRLARDSDMGNQQQNAAIGAAIEAHKQVAALKDTIEKVGTVFDRRDQLQSEGYVPLMRFGQHYLTIYRVDPMTGEIEEDENGEKVTEYFSLFESAAERDKAEAAMREEFGDDMEFDSGTMSEKDWERYRGVSPESVALFAGKLGIGMDDVFQEWYRMAASNRSTLKRLIHRKGTPGFSTDGSRVLASFLTSNGRRASMLYHMADVQEAIDDFPKQQGAEKDEATALLQYIQNPDEEAAVPRSLLFMHFLGGTVSNFLINATQPAMVTLPYISQFVGMPKAMDLLKEAYSLRRNPAKMSRELTDALARADQEGKVGAQEIHHLWQETARPLISALGRFGDDVSYRANAFMQLWGMPFAVAELMNRQVTFISAYNAAKESGKSPDAAYAMAIQAIDETQFIYGKQNRPNWARGTLGSLIFTFKLFSISYTELLVRMLRGSPESQKAALYMLGMLFLAAGTQGLPGSDDLDDLIDTVAQMLGYNVSSKLTKRKWVESIAGKEVANFTMHGLSALSPLDVSSRMSLGNLIPGTSILKPSNTKKESDVLEIIGPVGGLAMSYINTSDAVSTGNWNRATTEWMPKALKDLVRGSEMMVTGEARDSRGRKVADINPVEAAIKMAGFNPQAIAEIGRNARDVQQTISFARRTEGIIAERWARGIVDGNADDIQAAKAAVVEWNATNPETPIDVKYSTVIRRAAAMRSNKEDRFIKAATKGMREYVKENIE